MVAMQVHSVAPFWDQAQNTKWTKDRGNEPKRDKDDVPWFWSGNDFIGDRVNDVHLTNQDKMDARRNRS
jgi:hypothetical protein